MQALRPHRGQFRCTKGGGGAILLIVIYPGRLFDIRGRFTMKHTPQQRELKNYRNRLNERGMARYEVLGLKADRDLIRSLAKRLAEHVRGVLPNGAASQR